MKLKYMAALVALMLVLGAGAASAPPAGPGPATLNFDKDDGLTTATADATITYTLSYTNTNQFSVDNVTITDTLPAGVNFVSATGGGTHSAGVVTWDIGTVAPGASGSVTLTVQEFSGVERTLANSAAIEGDEVARLVEWDYTEIEPVDVDIDIKPGS
ncbi:DUF11 domain-containing protein [Methanococcoides sp. NM1]|uniref:DUF11 domain-containing protein n=1 Tax=Methanococcoides sp. NM1 TaxID=1201013 RepID=UPI001AEF8725|nr:DUF11 domain-containing protein [Methanococcoides sp. NM1]